MARTFNGTTDGMNRTLFDLSGPPATTIQSVSFWLNVPSWAAVQRRVIAHDNGTADNVVFSMDLSGVAVGAAANTIAVYFTAGAAVSYWLDSFPQPSANAWHHYAWISNRTVPSNVVYVDGVAQTMTAVTHNAAAYGGYANRTMWVMNRNSTNWAPGTLSELAFWGSNYTLTAADVMQLAKGAPASSVQPDDLVDYMPISGASSPEPDVFRGHLKFTVQGTPTGAAGGPHQVGLAGTR